VACTAETFAGYDALVLSTGHKQFKDPALYANVRLVVDTRNAVKLPDGAKGRLVKA
jgi:UDP-N-acetyl-D-glucosamine dehydrogenase